jgi:crossover junction endodeoxyribonuclease RuvC
LIILGIDPGSRNCGYGIIRIDKYKIIEAGAGIIKLKASDKLENKLKQIGSELTQIIQDYKPDFASVENIFYGKSIQTAFTLGHVRGVILYCLTQNNIPVYSYSPREIKQSVTGRGNATKQQVEYIVQSILKLSNPAKDDAADALASALCLFNKEKFSLLGFRV